MVNVNSSFVKGAATLAITGIAARGIGAIFRVVLAAVLGDEGIGLYQYAYPIYSTLLVISTAGIPVALSKIIAEKIALNDYHEALRVFRVAFIILSVSGLIISLTMMLGAQFISVVIVKDLKAYYPILAISPAIFFVTIMASLRGFFQGQQNMFPTAVSQLLEQLVRVLFAIIMVVIMLPVGLEYASAGATSGATAGGLAGLLLLFFLYRRRRFGLFDLAAKQSEHSPERVGHIIRRIFGLAIPITIGGLVIPLISLIDLAVVPRQLLEAGFEIERARALYGQLTGMASSVVYFPNVIALALSMSLVPAISEAFALKNKLMVLNRTEIAMKMTLLFALPSAAGLFLLAEPITILLFNNAEAGYSLSYMSWSVIPLCFYVTTTGLIQGLGRPIVPALNMLYGGIVKTILAWHLTVIPALNVGGAALASVIGIAVAAILNINYVMKHTGWRINIREFILLPGISMIIMSVFVYFPFRLINTYGAALMTGGWLNAISTLFAIAVGIIVYGVTLLLMGVLNEDELRLIPYIGSRISKLRARFKIDRRQD
ncbi:MAG: polysaccharide biosynthesis protein [Bacillota bacterium]|nr:polysaccharide biosynthesis protein [Bacillota bacterium]